MTLIPFFRHRAFIDYGRVGLGWQFSLGGDSVLLTFRWRDRPFMRWHRGTRSLTMSLSRLQVYCGIGDDHSPFTRAEWRDVLSEIA
jgi:hypothetical protein